MQVLITDGDLLDQPVEVIVNAWNRNIIPWWLLLPQGVSGAQNIAKLFATTTRRYPDHGNTPRTRHLVLNPIVKISPERTATSRSTFCVIQDTETVYCEGFKILAPEREGGEVAYSRKPFRDFRLFARGANANESEIGTEHQEESTS